LIEHHFQVSGAEWNIAAVMMASFILQVGLLGVLLRAAHEIAWLR
jgi:hypothetical protein